MALRRKSDNAEFRVFRTASVVIVNVVDGDRIIDSYQLTPAQSLAFRNELSKNEAAVRIDIANRREQDRNDGLTQLDLIDRATQAE